MTEVDLGTIGCVVSVVFAAVFLVASWITVEVFRRETLLELADANAEAAMPAAKPPAKTPEEIDEEKLREVEAKIKEILALMGAGHTREKADERLEGAREKLQLNAGSKEPAFHKPSASGKPVTVTRHTASLLELAESLELRIRLGQYASELQDALFRHTDTKVQVLERKLKRARY